MAKIKPYLHDRRPTPRYDTDLGEYLLDSVKQCIGTFQRGTL